MPPVNVDPSKKKRGRPKKVKGADGAPLSVPTPAATPNGATNFQNTPPTGTGGGGGGKSTPNNRPTTATQNSTIPANAVQQTHFNSPNNFNLMHNPVDTLTPPPSVGYQQQNLGPFNGAGTMQGGGGGGGLKSSSSSSAPPGVGGAAHPNAYQQSPQPHSQGAYPQSDVGSEMSVAMSGEHMSNSPAAVTSPVDFGRSSSDNTQNECRFSSPASTISEQQSQHSQHMQQQMQQSQILQQSHQQIRQHQGKMKK